MPHFEALAKSQILNFEFETKVFSFDENFTSQTGVSRFFGRKGLSRKIVPLVVIGAETPFSYEISTNLVLYFRINFEFSVSVKVTSK